MEISETTFIVNSEISCAGFAKWATQKWRDHKYLTFTFRVGEERSLDQNALLHLWLTLYAAHLAKIDRKVVSEEMLEFMKQKAKYLYYTQTAADWMIRKMVNPKSGAEGKVYYRSSADYKVGEMFQFLTWLQNTAANDGLLLESRGQYQKLQKQHNGE
jgi:hypothetical protein